MNANEGLERYADRGEQRGAREVLDAAANRSFTARPVEAPGRSRANAFLNAAVAIVVAGFIALAAVVIVQGDGSAVASGPEDRVGSKYQSDEEMRLEVEEHWASVQDGGWVRYSGQAAVEGEDPPTEAWAQINPTPDGLREAYFDGVAVYTSPGGDLVGYEYANLGFVSRERAEAPGFDAEALRRERAAEELGQGQ